MTQTRPAAASGDGPPPSLKQADVGLIGLAVMGQNLALNIASNGFPIAVHNRSPAKVHDTVQRALREGVGSNMVGYEDIGEFVLGLKRPRKVILLVKAGVAVDAMIAKLEGLLDEGDLIVDGGNEFYERTVERSERLARRGILYMGMGVSGGEEGARFGPSLMPGGPRAGYDMLEDILNKIAAHVDDGPCVTYIGPGGSGNYVKMIHNGIEYGDMQLIGEAYDVLRTVGGCSEDELADIFEQWNAAELQSFLIEISARILKVKDDIAADGSRLINKILDQTGSKGTGMWTIQEAAQKGIPIPTIAAALDARYLSASKGERQTASLVLKGPDPETSASKADKAQLVEDMRKALYASKICSYAQGMNLIREAGERGGWGLDLGSIARIWKGGCIIQAKFLDRIKAAYDRKPKLSSLLLDEEFAAELEGAQDAWRRIVCTAVKAGIAVPALSGSLAYYDTSRRQILRSSQMVQAQRDFFGSHTYRRIDRDEIFHTRWASDGVSVAQK